MAIKLHNFPIKINNGNVKLGYLIITPTPSPTLSATPTPTVTATPFPTGTATPIPTMTPPATGAPAPSPTITPTETPVPTISPAPTPMTPPPSLSPTPTPTPVGWRYYLWKIFNTRDNLASGEVKASEFVFQLNGSDQSMAGVTVTNPSGNNPSGEGPQNLADGNTSTKGLDLNFISNGLTNFIFQFSSAKAFNGYRWATANDEESRDPKSWTVAGSNNGTTWTTLHTVSGFVATTARFTYQTAQTY